MEAARIPVWIAVALVAFATGCARPRPAVAPPPPPPLEVPVVPPRVLAPVSVEPDESATTETEPAQAPRRPRPRPRTDTGSPRSPEPGTTEPARSDQGAPEQPGESRPSAAATPPAPELTNEAEARRITDTIGRARAELGRVDAQRLGSDARTQYETARRFVDQAQDALKVRNYLFAKYLADKAEALARGLQGR